MNATSNPQTAAEQARKNYSDMTTPNMAVPEAVRAMAAKAVDQSREVYDRSKGAFEVSQVTFEKSFDAAGQSAAAFNRKIIDIAQQNLNYLNSCFDLAKSLAGGKNLSEKAELQAVYLQKQFSALTAQAEEVRAALDQDGGRRGRAAQGTGETLRGWARDGALNGLGSQ